MNGRNTNSGFSIIELLVLLAICSFILAMALPTLAKIRSSSGEQVSMSNLITLSTAHAWYAADHKGAQFVTWPHDLAKYGSTQSTALNNYAKVHGPVPGVQLGWNHQGFWMFTNYGAGLYNLYQPVGFTGAEIGFGIWRLMNVRAFHAYVDGKFYGTSFYAPNDQPAWEAVEPLFPIPGQFYNPDGGSSGSTIYTSSYGVSPAALFHSDVMRAPSLGGFQNVWGLDHGLTTPPLYAAAYPDLKTHIIEVHWNQNPPAPCNPAIEWGPFNGCQPYYFNHGIDSTPLAAFYDGHVRFLPNSEVQAWDQLILQQTKGVDGLWSRDTPFGSNGFFLDTAYDDIVDVSHHVLTTNGILGRDTLGLNAPPLKFKRGRKYIAPYTSPFLDMRPDDSWHHSSGPAFVVEPW